jgi:hypothetical protein
MKRRGNVIIRLIIAATMSMKTTTPAAAMNTNDKHEWDNTSTHNKHEHENVSTHGEPTPQVRDIRVVGISPLLSSPFPLCTQGDRLFILLVYIPV